MAAEDTWVWWQGQEGRAMRGCLKSNGVRTSLDQFDEVKVHVAKTVKSALLVDESAVPDADQTSTTSETEGKGWFTYTISEAAAAIKPTPIKDGKPYLLSFVGIVNDVPYYFPTNKSGARTYAALVVHDPLGPNT